MEPAEALVLIAVLLSLIFLGVIFRRIPNNKEEDMKVEVKEEDGCIKIYIRELLHLCIRKKGLYGIQSFIDGSVGMYVIEYYNEDRTSIRTEYNDLDKWVAILKQLDEKITFV